MEETLARELGVESTQIFYIIRQACRFRKLVFHLRSLLSVSPQKKQYGNGQRPLSGFGLRLHRPPSPLDRSVVANGTGIPASESHSAYGILTSINAPSAE